MTKDEEIALLKKRVVYWYNQHIMANDFSHYSHMCLTAEEVEEHDIKVEDWEEDHEYLLELAREAKAEIEKCPKRTPEEIREGLYKVCGDMSPLLEDLPVLTFKEIKK